MRPMRAAEPRLTPTNLVRTAALSLALVAASLGTAGAAQANSLSAPVVSAGPQATVPMTVSVSGSGDPSAALRVYVQEGTGGCAGEGTGPQKALAQSLRPGSTEVIAQQPVGPFAYSATYTPPVAGGYLVCAYLYGTSAGAGVSQTTKSFAVGPAPQPPPPPPPAATAPAAPGTTGLTPAKRRCVVPTLKGRTYLGARTLIRRAGCTVGTVFRPDLRTSRIARARGRVLRVVSQSPKPRTARALNARVTLRLAYVTPKRSSSSG